MGWATSLCIVGLSYHLLMSDWRDTIWDCLRSRGATPGGGRAPNNQIAELQWRLERRPNADQLGCDRWGLCGCMLEHPEVQGFHVQVHDKKVKRCGFVPRHFVLKLAKVLDPNLTRGKFSPTWEGPYLIKEVFPDESCKLSTPDGQGISRHCHPINLRCYYSLSIYFLA